MNCAVEDASAAGATRPRSGPGTVFGSMRSNIQDGNRASPNERNRATEGAKISVGYQSVRLSGVQLKRTSTRVEQERS